jgi:FixJ family two-component response regulator
LEEYENVARRLVATLGADELEVLRCLVRGMSGRDIAAITSNGPGDFERISASMMEKLNARRIVDAVRIGLYAGVHCLD